MKTKRTFSLSQKGKVLTFCLGEKTKAFMPTSFLARAAMTLLLVMLTAMTAWAAEWPSYITNVVLVGGTEDEAQDAKSNYSGYTWCSQRLNEGKNADIIYIGYKTSSSADTNGDYITDFIIIDAGSGTEGHNPPYSLTFQGRTYYRCPAAGGDYFVNSNHGNLTSQAANGWNMYLYYTKNSFDDKRAVSSINITKGEDTKSGSIDCYYKDGTLHEADISLNRGVSGTPFVYMHINTTTKVNRPNPEPTTISGLTYNGSPLKLISSNYNNYNSGTVYYRVGTSGSYTSDVNNVTATNAGTYTIYYYSGESYYGNSSVDYAHTMTATIAKSPNNGLTVSCADVVDGSTPNPQLGGTNLSTGTVTYQYSTTQNGTYTSTVPTDLGRYYVKATIAGDANHSEYTTAAASFCILADANDLWNIKGGANGTLAYPFRISNPAGLYLLASKVNGGRAYSGKYFVLGANITYDDTANNYTPIGTESHAFAGHFDGKGYRVSGLNINNTLSNYVGLFGNANGASISNLVVSGCTFSGASYVGGVAGKMTGTMSNCLVIGTTVSSTNDNTSGIIAGSFSGTLSNNYYDWLSYCNRSSGIGYGVGGDSAHDMGDNASFGVRIIAADGVNLALAGTATATYSANGFVIYTDGLMYQGVCYKKNGDVTLHLTYSGTIAPDYALAGFKAYGTMMTDLGNDNYLVSLNGLVDCIIEPYITIQYWTGAGTEADPYLITSVNGLNHLSEEVNNGNTYEDKHFALGADLEYDRSVENNFTPIGYNSNSRFFKASLDGRGHTISGINTIRPADESREVGIIGYSQGTKENRRYIRNLTVVNSSFVSINRDVVAAICGSSEYTDIENCHVGSDVYVSGRNNVGGIAGDADGSHIRGCTSGATVVAQNKYAGGICGYFYDNTIDDCIYYGNSITGNNKGAIVGSIYPYYIAEITNCYYTTYGIGGVRGADQDGARFAIATDTKPNTFGNATKTYGTGTYTGIKVYGTNGLEYGGKYYWHDEDLVVLKDHNTDDINYNADLIVANDGQTRNVGLNGRTLYKDGTWQTICLPFALSAEQIAAGPFAGTTIKELDATNTLLDASTGALTLAFNKATSIKAGKPYIVKWNSEMANTSMPLFNLTDDDITALNFISEVPAYDNGQASNWNNYTEGPAKLVDGKTGTKYGLSNSNPWVEFHYASAITPKGYALWTAGDAGDGSRNPKSWTIKAKNDGDADWTTLVTVDNSDGDKLPKAINTCTVFALNNSTAYKYFRFEAGLNASNNAFQLAELQFCTKQPSTGFSTDLMFNNVTIDAKASTEVPFTGGKFVGTYSPFATTDGLLLDAHNTDNGAFHAALSATTSDGNVLEGWYTDAGKTTPATTIPFTADGSATLYVKWAGDVPSLPGDANGDGKVTLADAVAIVNYLLGRPSPGFNAAVADVNGDGEVTITDAVMLVNMIGSQP